MDVATWNVLHDGRITAAEADDSGKLRLSVEIGYLCRHLPTEVDHLDVTLLDCTHFEYRPFDEAPVTDPSAIADLGVELLSATDEAVPGALMIECADEWSGGQLVLRYVSAAVCTAEGHPLSQSELETASEEYWSEWERSHARP